MSFLNTLNFIIGHPLNENQKGRALMRWGAWHLGGWIRPGPVAVPFVNASRLLVSRGMGGATGNIYAGLHEFPEMAFVLHLLRPGDLFIDVGANVGAYTVLASGAVQAKSISIEPIPHLYAALIQNIRLNRMEPLVDARNNGIGAEKGKLRFTSSYETINHVLRPGEERNSHSIEVEIQPLDEACAGLQPKLIKVDVEGFESAVIAGAPEVLSRPGLDAVILELHGAGKRYGYDEHVVHRKMLEYGFRTFIYSPFERTLSLSREIRKAPYSTLYARNLEHVKERLGAAPKFRIQAVSRDL